MAILLFLGLAKNRRYSEMAAFGRSITLKKPYNLGLEMGGGIGREVVLGGTTVLSRAVLGTEFVGRTRNLFGYDVIGIVQSGAVVALPGCRDWFKRHLVTS